MSKKSGDHRQHGALIIQCFFCTYATVHGESPHHLIVQANGHADEGRVLLAQIPGSRSVEKTLVVGHIGDDFRATAGNDPARDAFAHGIMPPGLFGG